MGIQENVNRSIGSLARLVGLIKIKESIKFKDLISNDPKLQMKNFQEAQEKIQKGEAKLTRKERKKLEEYTAGLEKKIHDTPLPEYSPVANDTKAPDDFDIDSLDSATPNQMNPYMAAERAKTAIDDKQLEYSFSKPKATILPFEPKD